MKVFNIQSKNWPQSEDVYATDTAVGLHLELKVQKICVPIWHK